MEDKITPQTLLAECKAFKTLQNNTSEALNEIKNLKREGKPYTHLTLANNKKAERQKLLREITILQHKKSQMPHKVIKENVVEQHKVVAAVCVYSFLY